ncbi:MAG: glutamyl-tRNA reductase [Gemmatimonadota bacterium]|jgi:glutamyl-tRNA reductase
MLTVGASHRTATAAMLGDFGRAAESFRAAVREGAMGRDVPVRELAVLSTCARVEVYAVADGDATEEALGIVEREVFGISSGADDTPYRYRGPDAVRHLCRVASGLESFVIGEHEISGQVQRAFKEVVRVRDDASVLQGVAAVAKRASGRVRSETAIGRYPASVSSVAVDIVRERLGDLPAKRVLVVGAGKAGLLVARALRSSGVVDLTVVNRSLERAREVAAEVGGRVAELGRLAELLVDADVVMTATGAEGVVVDARTAAQAVEARGRMRGPLLVLDLALPGDVHPDVGELEEVKLLTLEDVKSRVHRHLSLRRDELGAAERVVDEVIADFLEQQESPDVETVIGELRRSIEEVRSTEVDRWLARREGDLPPSRDELDHLTRSIVNKLLHEPMRRLRSAPVEDECRRAMLEAASELFGDGSGDAEPGG